MSMWKKTNGKHDKHTCIVPKDAKTKWCKGVGLQGNIVECVGVEFECEYCHTPQFRRVNA